MSVPFRGSPDRDPLAERIDAEVRQRLEEAVDYACLEMMVARRRARGLPPPEKDSAEDRREFERAVVAFLSTLQGELAEPAAAKAPAGDEAGRLLALQVSLAKSLPDYWQRFDAVRTAWVADAAAIVSSGRDSRGLLARLFGRS